MKQEKVESKNNVILLKQYTARQKEIINFFAETLGISHREVTQKLIIKK